MDQEDQRDHNPSWWTRSGFYILLMSFPLTPILYEVFIYCFHNVLLLNVNILELHTSLNFLFLFLETSHTDSQMQHKLLVTSR